MFAEHVGRHVCVQVEKTWPEPQSMLDNTASNQIYNSQWLNSSVVVNCGESHTQCGLATCSALHHLYCLYLSHKISQTRHKLLMLLFISAWSIYPLVLRESQLQRMRVWDNFSPLGKLSTWHGCIFESRFPDGRQLEPVRRTSLFSISQLRTIHCQCK